VKKLISFCLYGNNPKYIMGFYKNIALKEKFYPDWDLIVFHDTSVEGRRIEEYRRLGVITRDVTGFGIHPTAWRFLAFDEDNSHRAIFRDADSRLSLREAEAVKEWEESDKPLHIMRDHPHHHHHHWPIFAGMWGIAGRRVDNGLSMLDLVLKHQGGAKDYTMESSRGHSQGDWGTDQYFLRDCLYASFGTEECSTIHVGHDYTKAANYQKREYWSTDFPSPRNEDKNFVGEVIEIIDGKEQRAYQYTEL